MVSSMQQILPIVWNTLTESAALYPLQCQLCISYFLSWITTVVHMCWKHCCFHSGVKEQKLSRGPTSFLAFPNQFSGHSWFELMSLCIQSSISKPPVHLTAVACSVTWKSPTKLSKIQILVLQWAMKNVSFLQIYFYWLNKVYVRTKSLKPLVFTTIST